MADETPAPLSDAEIEEVRRGVAGAQEEMRAYSPIARIKADRFNEVSHFDHICADMYVFQVVPRLLATLAAYREIVAALAAMDDTLLDPPIYRDAEEYPCPLCLVDFNNWGAQHTPTCPVTRARALITGQ